MRVSSLAVESNDGTDGGTRVLAEKNHAYYHVYKMKYYDECVCMSLYHYVCLLAYLKIHTSKLQDIFCIR